MCPGVQRAQMLRMVSSPKCGRRKVVDYQGELAEASKVALLNALWKRGAGIRSTASIRGTNHFGANPTDCGYAAAPKRL